jgi:hypothetical protein
MSDTRFLESPDGSVLTVLHAQHDRVRELLAEFASLLDHARDLFDGARDDDESIG